MSMGTFYLILAAALIFGAGAFAAKKIRRRLKPKQVVSLALLAFAMVMVIWVFLALSTKKRGEVQLQPATEARPLLRPDRD
jgi:drug/metabolite transporter (DMT)-like permease